MIIILCPFPISIKKFLVTERAYTGILNLGSGWHLQMWLPWT